MIIEIKEYSYKGIALHIAKDQNEKYHGWKCNLGGVEYIFPHSQAAERAIDDIFQNIKPVIARHGGTKIK